MAEPQFEKWALSCSGMVGNPEGRYWFCGIEYGGKDEEDRKYGYIEKPEEWNETFKADNKEEYWKWPLYRKISKIMLAITKKGFDREIAREYQKKNLFIPGGDTFLMNIFPLSFHDRRSEWTKELARKTGFEDRKYYENWCKDRRIKYLKAYYKHYRNVKMLLCFGKEFANYIIGSFLDKNASQNIFHIKDIEIMHYIDGSKHVFISPFLGGRNGLNKNEDLLKLGKEIERVINSNARTHS